ncbi:MAG TPA: DUF3147 family protein [Candidatus Cloacimonadota bacterium]|nr:DUF3147 family protein [Candidatus Cloacimonadota bacterium]HPS38857.1 DUF3147 family protein [Candidatus Cloacimonadota bacterium]
MIYYIIKVLTSALLIVLISEFSKRSSFLGSVLASVPLVSFIAIFWIYFETKDVKRIGALSTDIFWLVIPSLLFFVIFPALLKRSVNFYLAFGISTLVMIGGYFLLTFLLKLK